jgi:hypothetical protein
VLESEANWCKAGWEPPIHDPTPPTSPAPDPDYSLPLVEIDIAFSSSATVSSILDSGSQIMVIREDLARQVGVKINPHCVVEVEGTNSGHCCTMRCAEHMPLQVGDATVQVHMHIIRDAPFQLLLRHPFQHVTLSCVEDLPSGKLRYLSLTQLTVRTGSTSSPIHTKATATACGSSPFSTTPHQARRIF